MIQPKKSLGQHFLINQNYCKRILELAEIKDNDTLMEIGPGTGALTAHLIQCSSMVHAVEFDRDMVAVLKESFAAETDASPPRLVIHQENVLKSDWGKILYPENPQANLGGGHTKTGVPVIIGNLPYNIATRILEHSTRFKDLFRNFTFMTQKEVSMRIQARPGSADYGYFTLLMDFHFERIKGFDVPPGAFLPPPKVMSHVMQVRPRFIETSAEKEFITIVKASFSQRRKTIFNNLKNIFPDKKILQSVLEECAIKEKTRPQEMSLEQFLSVSEVSRRVLSFRS